MGAYGNLCLVLSQCLHDCTYIRVYGHGISVYEDWWLCVYLWAWVSLVVCVRMSVLDVSMNICAYECVVVSACMCVFVRLSLCLPVSLKIYDSISVHVFSYGPVGPWLLYVHTWPHAFMHCVCAYVDTCASLCPGVCAFVCVCVCGSICMWACKGLFIPCLILFSQGQSVHVCSYVYVCGCALGCVWMF